MSIVAERVDRAVGEEWFVPDGYELVDGELVEMPMGAESGRVAGELYRRLAAHCDSSGAGVALPSDIGYRCFPHRPRLLRKPDASFLRAESLSNGRVPKGDIRFAPDLVAEAISPNDLAESVQEKIADYLKAGVRLVWIIYPGSRMAVVHAPNGAARWIDENGVLDGENVIAGFRCRLGDILQAPEPENTDSEDAAPPSE